MSREDIRTKVKAIIAGVTGLEADSIGDQASLRDDLNVDSLSRLEVGVDVDYAFQLKLPDETYAEVDTVDAMVELVARRLSEKAA